MDLNLRILGSFDDAFLLTAIFIMLLLGISGLILSFVCKRMHTKHDVFLGRCFLGLFFLDKISFLSVLSISSMSSFFVFFVLFSFFVYLLSYPVLLVLSAVDIISVKKNKDFDSFWFGRVYDKVCNFLIDVKQCIVTDVDASLSFGKRFLLLLCPSFLFAYMTCVFGVSESFFGNVQEWLFLFSDVYPIMFVVLFFVLVCVSLLSIFLKPKYVKMFVYFASIFCLMMYLQNVFFNQNTFMNGSHDKVSVGDVFIYYSNTLLWLVVCIGGTIFCLKSKFVSLKIVVFVDLMLLTMQVTPLPVMILDYYDRGQILSSEITDLDYSTEFDIASKENVVVFIMDTYARDYWDDMKSIDSGLSEELSDFICCDNVSTDVCVTALSLPHLFTAKEIDYSVGLLESHKCAWDSLESTYFYDTCHDNGYEVHMYTDSAHCLGGIDNLIGKIDNISTYRVERNVHQFGTFFALARLSFYKYFPDIFKFLFWVSGSESVNEYVDEVRTDVSGMAAEGPNEYMRHENCDYIDGVLRHKRIRSDIDKQVVFIHLSGMHKPFRDANGDECDVKTTFDLVMREFFEYVDFLKDNGLYDSSTIVLTADHGVYPEVGQGELVDLDFGIMDPVFLIKPKYRHNDVMIENHVNGYLQEDLLPTLLDAMGFEYADVYNGCSLLSDGKYGRLRSLKLFGLSDEFPDAKKVMSFGNSCINYYVEYKYEDNLRDMVMSTDGSLHGIVDFWW